MPPSVHESSEPLASDAPVCDATPSCGANPLSSDAGAGLDASSCDATDPTSSPSDMDSTWSSSDSQDSRRKSVRFSIVRTREYVVEELDSGDHDENDVPLTSLGWEYTEKETDIETHMEEMKQERREQYLSMIRDHIHRVELKHEAQDSSTKTKKKGFKSRVLKPLWRGLIEAGSRSALVIPTGY